MVLQLKCVISHSFCFSANSTSHNTLTLCSSIHTYYCFIFSFTLILFVILFICLWKLHGCYSFCQLLFRLLYLFTPHFGLLFFFFFSDGLCLDQLRPLIFQCLLSLTWFLFLFAFTLCQIDGLMQYIGAIGWCIRGSGSKLSVFFLFSFALH